MAYSDGRHWFALGFFAVGYWHPNYWSFIGGVAFNLWILVNNNWKQVTTISVLSGDVWKTVTSLKFLKSGTWK